MKIVYSPYYSGGYYVDLNKRKVCLVLRYVVPENYCQSWN